MINRVRGTEDIIDLRLYNFLLTTIKHHLALYNFTEIDTPILEPTELFTRAVGSQTDIVSKEMYTFQTSGGELICLRPEATASIIRAYSENRVENTPWKVFLHGPMFRHERPQKGRWRQFNQTSVEIVNAPSITHDAYMIKMLDSLFNELFKLETYILKLNFLGCSEDRKKHKEALLAFLETNKDKLCETCLTRKDNNTLRVFDCKNDGCIELYKHAPNITDRLCPSCLQEWQTLQHLLDLQSVSYVVDQTLVRGLDYYNKTVFEFSSRDLGAQNTFCGGGRYSLGKDIGDTDDIAGVGAGIGMGRLALLVEKNLNKLSLPQEAPLHVIIPLTEQQVPLALMLANELLSRHLTTDVLLEKANISNLMKKANKMGATYTLIIGPDEQAQGTVSVKNMQKGESTVVKQAELIPLLRR